MLKKINCCVKFFTLTTLILIVTSASALAAQTAVPCVFRVEVSDSNVIRSDFARLGSFNNTRWRTWAEFDISSFAGKTVTGVGLRVYNEWGGSQITSLRYAAVQPSVDYDQLNGLHQFQYKYNGFGWNINTDGAWTPSETDFFRPTAVQWNTWTRQNGNSIIKDLQDHIDDEDKEWFGLEFDCFGGCDGAWQRVNMRFPDDRYNPRTIYLEITTEEDVTLAVFKNLGFGGCTLTENSINFATGNKFKAQTDLSLTGPGLPLVYRRYYNSQSTHNGYLGYGWTGTFSESVTPDNGNMILREAYGNEVHFTDDGQGKYVSEADEVRTIEAVAGGWLLAESDGSSLEFDSGGNLIRITDLNGNTQTVGYADGKLSYVEDNYGRRLDFAYNSDGRLESLTTPVGQFIYSYEQENLSGVTKPDLTGRIYSYNDPYDPHNLTGITDEREKSASYEYDDQDRAVASEGIGGINRVSVAYEAGLIRKVTDSAGKTITYELQGEKGIGRIKSSSGSGCASCPGGTGSQYKLNDRLQIETVTDAMGNDTSYTYDTRGNVLTKKEAEGTADERITTYTYHPVYNLEASVIRESVLNPEETTVKSFDYDDSGNLTHIVETGFSDAGSVTRTTTLDYDTEGRLIVADGPRTDVSDVTLLDYYPNDPSQGYNRGMLKKITNPLEHEILFSLYNAFGKPGEIKNANGVVTTIDYDLSGRLISRTTAGYTTTAGYDDAGNMTSFNMPGEREITFSYTDAGLLERAEDKSGNYVRYFYDTERNRTREEIRDKSDVLKKFTDFEFDDFNRVKKSIYPGDYFEERDYDDNSNLITSTDPNKKITDYDYDHLNRLETETMHGGIITAYGYDSHDNQVSVRDAEGNSTSLVYDDMGRLLSEDSPVAGKTDYVYDEADNVISKTDGRGITVTCQYDPLSRRTAIRFPDSSQDITYEYDSGPNAKGRLASMTDSSGQTTYAYNALGQLTQETRVADGQTYITQYGYDPATAEMSSMTYPSGMTVTYQREDSGNFQVTGITADGKAVTKSASYLPFGPVAGWTFGDSLFSVTREYDERYMLKRSVAGSAADYEYIRDAAGNILSVSGVELPSPSGGMTQYEHVGNRLTASTGAKVASYTYDGHGNIVSDGTRTFDYDQNNRLVRVSEYETVLGEYFYDGRGRRVKKIASGVTTLYHYDYKDNLIAETDGNGIPLRDVIYQNGERVAMKLYGDYAGMYYFINDHLGTAHKIINSAGAVVWLAAYSGFGEAHIITETITNNFRFPGQYYDEETELHYNWHRYYDPKTGRYMTPDPIGFRGGDVNLYVYCLNNPVNYVDPDGRMVGLLALIVGAMSSPAMVYVGLPMAIMIAAYYGYYSSQHPLNIPAFPMAGSSGYGSGTSSGDNTTGGSCPLGDPDDNDNLTDKIGKIAEKTGKSKKAIKQAIHKVKEKMPKGGPKKNPDVMVDTITGEVYPKTPSGGIGDSIGNIFNHL
ncbi:MAG: hypothetical protein GY795_43405 [Desulfobacterales bacterium]|nr:hypothetical protein [Desulfobacterales bacterium]